LNDFFPSNFLGGQLTFPLPLSRALIYKGAISIANVSEGAFGKVGVEEFLTLKLFLNVDCKVVHIINGKIKVRGLCWCQY